jgi:hypothetical protein
MLLPVCCFFGRFPPLPYHCLSNTQKQAKIQYMNSTTLRDLFYRHEGGMIHKWDHYLDVYERHFHKYRGRQLNLLEIGVSHGGSIQLWKKYFGPQVNIYAIDVNPECKKFEEENVKIFIGSQSDKTFLQDVLKQIPRMDVIIDDGGHTMIQQIVSFETLYMHVVDGGLYLVEDTHTSYWFEFRGGLKKRNTFVEYSKNLIDSLYEAHLHKKDKLVVNEITRNINSISFYDSMVVFEKRKRDTPFHTHKGKETIAPFEQRELKKRLFLLKMKAKLFGGKRHTYEVNEKE